MLQATWKKRPPLPLHLLVYVESVQVDPGRPHGPQRHLQPLGQAVGAVQGGEVQGLDAHADSQHF